MLALEFEQTLRRSKSRREIGQAKDDFLALLALIALRNRFPGAIALVWLCIIVGTLDTVNAIIQSVRDSVFTYALGVNWVIVAIYVPALLVSSLLIFLQLLRPNRSTRKG